MIFAFKMMVFSLKMMNFQGSTGHGSRGARRSGSRLLLLTDPVKLARLLVSDGRASSKAPCPAQTSTFMARLPVVVSPPRGPAWQVV